jgi:hypothetical protein
MTVLDTYVSQVQGLLHDTNGALYSTALLQSYINSARGQIAGEAACIRQICTLTTTTGNNSYLFSAITIPGTAVGASQVLAVRKAAYTTTGTTTPYRLDGRPWDYFFNYCLTAPTSGAPSKWSQLTMGNQGVAVTSGGAATGTLYVWPTPTVSTVGTLTLDCVLTPYALDNVSNLTEALPYPWTDAVQYFAAYLAYTNAQRNADADRMWGLYQGFMQRARDIATPSALPRNFPISSQISGLPSVTPGPFPGGKGGSK